MITEKDIHISTWRRPYITEALATLYLRYVVLIDGEEALRNPAAVEAAKDRAKEQILRRLYGGDIPQRVHKARRLAFGLAGRRPCSHDEIKALSDAFDAILAPPSAPLARQP